MLTLGTLGTLGFWYEELVFWINSYSCKHCYYLMTHLLILWMPRCLVTYWYIRRSTSIGCLLIMWRCMPIFMTIPASGGSKSGTPWKKIATHGQNLRFHFLVEKWPSLGELLRKKNRKSWKHVFYTNWTILSRKKKFFEKIFLNDPKSRKSPIFNIFWTALTN